MSALDSILMGLVADHINFGADKESDEMFKADFKQAKQQINDLIAEAYKKGHIDGSIEVVNGTCSICGSYPMTANCNNAGCDK